MVKCLKLVLRSMVSLSLCIRLDVHDQYGQLSVSVSGYVSVSVSVSVSEFHEGLCAHIEATACSYQICVCTYQVCRLCARSIIGLSQSSCGGVWDPWPAEYQSCDLNNIVVQKATIGFVATFAQLFSFLILTSSSRTCSCIQKVSRIFVFPSLSCFQLIRHKILRFSNIQCRLALN